MDSRTRRGAWVVALGAVVLAGLPALASGGDVRPLQARGARLLEQGLQASPSLAALVAELRASDVVVYVDMDPHAPGALDGAIRFRGAAAGVRYLLVWLNCRHVDADIISTLAHELHHATEVAQAPDVRTLESFSALYDTIGSSRLSGRYETEGAQATTARVRRELRERRPRLSLN